MSWELGKSEDAYSASPGMNQFDDYIRKNVIITKLEDMLAWRRKKFNLAIQLRLVAHPR